MASLSLYRKWRPKSFSDVVGQNHIKTTLINALKSDRISHAYLFTGPRGIGKTTIARILAQAVNCKKSKNGEPCGKCEGCIDISSGTSMDLIEIDAASNRGIDEIRELREKIKFTPHNNKYKVFIIDEVHMLTKEAFNALLKTLEEPPAHAIFILATTESHKIPSTVLSRCQRFNFSKISQPLIIERLEKIAKEEKIKASRETLKMIASYSEGALRDAESILDQVSSFGNKNLNEELIENILGIADLKVINELLKSIISKNSQEALKIINQITEDGVDINILIDNLIEKTRDLMFIKVGDMDKFLHYDEKELQEMKDLSDRTEVGDLIKIIELLSEAKQKVKFSMPNHLPLELAILEMNGDKNSADSITEKQETPKEPPAKKETNQNTANQIKTESPKNEKITAKENGPKIKIDKTTSNILSSVKNNWQKILDELKSYNHSIALCLKTATPERIENGYLILSFDFSFHKDKIQNIKNKRIVEDAIKKITGKFIPIRGFVGVKKQKKEKSIIDDAVDILGGEIIE